MAKKLWGGRFKKSVDAEFFEFQKSIGYDYLLAEEDAFHSLIHVAVLRECGILSAKEAARLTAALKKIETQIKDGAFVPDEASEDIHTDIHAKVERLVGLAASKLHTLRSRNDQVAFDEKFFCLKLAQEIASLIDGVRESLSFLAAKNKGQFFIGYTHLQRAQVVTFSHYLGAFSSMLGRDAIRLKAFCCDLAPCVGAGALAGSSLKRQAYGKVLKKLFGKNSAIRVVDNPLDHVADRDFIVEFLGVLSMVQMHLSRLAEDFILYATKEFDFIDLPEEFCTGSSLMPHKKNPDFLELVRGYTGVITGNLVSILTTMKGLPLSYNRDMQTDKLPLFSSVSIIREELSLMKRFLKGVRLKRDSIAQALRDEKLYATELAEFLVIEKKVPFQQAHEIVGRMIRFAEERGQGISALSDAALKGFHPAFSQAVTRRVMNPVSAVASKKSVQD